MIGRRRRKILQAEVGNDLVPALLAGLGLERDQIVVGRLHVEIVVPHPEAAIADVRSASRLPVVVPPFVPIARIERPGIVGGRDVDRAVHDERGSLDRVPAAADELAGSLAADNHGPPTRSAWAVGQSSHPRQRQVLHCRLVDLLERAVTLPRVVAGVGGPRVRERLEEIGGCNALPLSTEPGSKNDRQENDRRD